MRREPVIVIARPVDLLKTVEAIAAAFDVGPKTVRRWRKEGAPIVLGEKGKYLADKAELWAWYREKRRAS